MPISSPPALPLLPPLLLPLLHRKKSLMKFCSLLSVWKRRQSLRNLLLFTPILRHPYLQYYRLDTLIQTPLSQTSWCKPNPFRQPYYRHPYYSRHPDRGQTHEDNLISNILKLARRGATPLSETHRHKGHHFWGEQTLILTTQSEILKLNRNVYLNTYYAALIQDILISDKPNQFTYSSLHK
jgi:hypothetical protein